MRNAASSVFERDETTNRIKWEDKVVNAETGETKKVPVSRPNIPGTAILNLQSWLSATYNDLRSASGNILQAAVAELQKLGLGYWDALKEQKILEALMKDAQKMGGDKDYKVDIGV